jgi:hypothetical protein
MDVKTSTIKAVADSTTNPLVDAVQKKTQVYANKPTQKALALKAKPPSTRVSRLFEMITTAGHAERISRLNMIMEGLRKNLPSVLARLPLRLSHLGFKRVEHLVQFLGEALLNMKTEASSLKEFVRGIKGWRWNIAGRLLFERLVKYHPQLDQFFRETAREFISLVNDGVEQSTKALVDISDKPRKVTGKFGKALKVVQFSLVGADDVERAFTDFGFIASNPQGLWAILPIELKMPAALGKVASQFGEFIPRLSEAKQIVALVEEGGRQRTIRIKPSDLVFLQHDRAQIVIAPLSKRQLVAALGGGTSSSAAQTVAPGAVASVHELDQRTSPTHGTIYYRIRLLVLRDWLESIVRVLTDSP